MIFKIYQTDYANKCVSGKYKINKKPVTIDWTDANGRIHKTVQCEKVSGTVDMFFRTQAEIEAFNQNIISHKTVNGTVKMVLSVNNTNKDETIDAFVDYELIRARDDLWQDYMLQATVTIQER